MREHLHPLGDFEAFVTEMRDRAVNAWAEAGRNLEAPHLGRVLVETLRALGVPEDRLDDEAADACLRAYNWGSIPGVRLYPDALEVIHHLRARGLRLGLVTNAFAPMWMREREMARLGLPPDLFGCRVCSADVGYLKPHPAIFQHALRSLGVRPEEAVFVGDNPEADIAGAQGVGMRAILRLGHRLPPMISGLIVPDAAINRLSELPAVLDGWHPGWPDAD